MVLEAVRNNGSALRFAGHAPRQQRHVVLAAVTLCGTVLHFAGEALQADPEVGEFLWEDTFYHRCPGCVCLEFVMYQ